MSNIEVEVRSFISEHKYKQLIEIMNQQGGFIDEINEETVYFSGEKDLRIRRDNKKAYLILKEGKIHDKHRKEIEIECQRNDFRKLEDLLINLGFEVKIRWFRKRKIYKWNDIKVLLDDTKGYGYIVELEKIGNEADKEKIYKKLEQNLKGLEVQITPKEKFDKKFQYYKENWRTLV